MENLFLFLSLSLLTFSGIQAQNTTFKKGDFDATVGFGLVPTFALDKGEATVPPVSLKLGYRLAERFSLNAYAAYSSATTSALFTDDFKYKWKNDFLMFGLKGAVHFNQIENFDIYGGFMLGYNVPLVKETITPLTGNGDSNPVIDENSPRPYLPAKNNLTYSGFIGVGYYPFKDIGFFAEAGYGISILQMGVNFRL